MQYQWKNESQARQEIVDAVAAYYHAFKENKKPFAPGDRIAYSGRVFDEKEMCSLTEAALDFWLTTGRFAEKLESEMAKYLGGGAVRPSGQQRLLCQSGGVLRAHST